jgi:hypothetical protein
VGIGWFEFIEVGFFGVLGNMVIFFFFFEINIYILSFQENMGSDRFKMSINMEYLMEWGKAD